MFYIVIVVSQLIYIWYDYIIILRSEVLKVSNCVLLLKVPGSTDYRDNPDHNTKVTVIRECNVTTKYNHTYKPDLSTNDIITTLAYYQVLPSENLTKNGIQN